MNNRIGKIISAVIAISLTLSMASCGQSDKSTEEPSKGVNNGMSVLPEKTEDKAEAEVDTAAEAEADDGAEAFAPETAGDEDAAAMDGLDAIAKGEAIAADVAGDTAGIAAEKPASADEMVTNRTDLPEAGQLTAGEWNDNDNWGFFANLVNSGTITFPSYNIDPRERVAVSVKGDDGEPIANAAVRLVGGEKKLWSAVTDRKGRAYLFTYGNAADSVEVEYGGNVQSYELSAAKTETDGEQGSGQITDDTKELVFKGSNGDKGSADAQIMFIVDTTSSMMDEMMFLQSEFSSLVKEVGSDGVEYAVNFYRDEGDDYVTKCMDFTTDVESLQNTIVNEYAEGGGDFPEAVGKIMEKSLTNGSWREDCVKLAFMIFDAPPHREDSEQVETAVRAAAEKGIRLIPVISSNSERDTELFGRALAITTGGSYVFLTDDSGIGDSHLEPIVGDYEVEKLYDIIIRLINEYRE